MKSVLEMGKSVAPIAIAFLLVAGEVSAQSHEDMMRATFKLAGPSKKIDGGEESTTAFVIELSRRTSRDRERRVAVVTAAHFFDNISSRRIRLVARRRNAEGGYEKTRYPLNLRVEKVIRHENEDVDAAAILIDWPPDFDLAPLQPEQVATTGTLRAASKPGRQVFALGYPFAIESTSAGFPVLRAARIASYPAPAGPGSRSFLIDMNMSHGFSGSPVYTPPAEGGDRAASLILGMIVGQHELTSEFKGPFETRKVHYPLDLGIVLPAPAIRELLDQARRP